MAVFCGIASPRPGHDIKCSSVGTFLPEFKSRGKIQMRSPSTQCGTVQGGNPDSSKDRWAVGSSSGLSRALSRTRPQKHVLVREVKERQAVQLLWTLFTEHLPCG